MSNCNTAIQFKNVSSISEELLLNILEVNVKSFFDWSFLQIGAWFDASIPNSGTIYGSVNPPYKLLRVDDEAYTDGQVWQGIRKEWVWESGACYSGNNPVNISGIYLNNTFHPYNSGTFTIDYPNGRVIFNSAINKNSNVQLNHSYRYVQVYRANNSPWFNHIQFSTFNTDNKDIKQITTGEWSIGGYSRIQLPAIVVESVPRSRSRPYEIGNTSLWLEQDIAFYVMAENKNDRNKLLDILRLQQDITIQLYDPNSLAQNDDYPLTDNGDLKSNALMYPDIIQQYPWRKCFFKNISLFELDSITPNLHMGMARATVEIISD
jgi:hypothetical protein